MKKSNETTNWERKRTVEKNKRKREPHAGGKKIAGKRDERGEQNSEGKYYDTEGKDEVGI